MNSTRKAWERKASEILHPHLGHIAMLQGWHEKEITAHTLAPDVLTLTYAGFVVECTTCGVSLSQQWND